MEAAVVGGGQQQVMPSSMAADHNWTGVSSIEDLMMFDEEAMAALMTMPLSPTFGNASLASLSLPLESYPAAPAAFSEPPFPEVVEAAPPHAVPATVPIGLPPTVNTTTVGGSKKKQGAGRAGGGGSTTVGGKKWASDEDWELHKPTITRLYVKENKRLWQLVDHMEREHGFFATPKMYKTRFKRWGLWKNTKAADVAEVLRQTNGTVSADFPAANNTTTTTETTTVTSVTTTKPTPPKTTTSSLSASASPYPASTDDQSKQGQVFLVNGKQVDLRRVERYIRNRCRQYRLKPSDLSATLINRISSGGGTPNPVPLPLTRNSGAVLLTEESTYRVIASYFDGSLSSGRWAFRSESECDLAGPAGTEMAKTISQFHERFKVAAPLLAQPDKHGAEGVKLARICFAELPQILSGAVGAEDPHLLMCFLIVLQYIRLQGEKLRWMEVQLAKHMADLAASLPAAKPTRHVWAAVRDSVMNRTMDDHLSLQCCKVSMDVLTAKLGAFHAKTLEIIMCSYCNFDSDAAAQEIMYRDMLAGLDALGTFDERHAGVRMNLATFYNMNGMYGKAEQVMLETVGDPWMLEQARRYRGLAFKYYWDLGRARFQQKKYEEAEKSYRDGIDEAKREMRENKGGKANVVEGLVELETCLREMGKEMEADEAKAEREVWIKEGLEGVDETEEVTV
ncbi:hypothetical protein B0H66DRAFT_108244 [Apodospora peruviana]|uniref:Clr5 domain-containing protein n=1 Tax=Apodospora peruviana TaxID=516989 RepID=A0AAE0IHG5_9PEZI|nr:hypothetical protein B0H66DRAFT_108244 [Apodospora peruviana]